MPERDHPSTLMLEPSLLTTEDDLFLMGLASQGNVSALEELYDRHAPLMYSVLTQKLGDPIEAQDIVHDVFLKLHAKSVLYNSALGKPVAWLLTVARNMAIDRLRKRATHQRYLQKQLQMEEATVPAHAGLHDDELALLKHCVETLPIQQREVLDLAYFSGLTQQEIAEQLVQPLGSVKAWVRRGLLRLKNCVEGKL